MLMHSPSPQTLPRAFCWTKFGPEAGEPIDQILARKEQERTATGGVFYWGIGNSIRPALTALLADNPEPEVLFSPIRSAPRRQDLAPPDTVRWLAGEGLFGDPVDLPPSVCVTSGWTPGPRRAARYALVCSSEQPLVLSNLGEVRFDALRNIRTSGPLGASQVTAVVSRKDGDEGRAYPVLLRAKLVWPFLVRLRLPVRIVGGRHAEVVEPQPLQLTAH
jgi:hypothetical protein